MAVDIIVIKRVMRRFRFLLLFVLSIISYEKMQAQQLDGFKYVWVETLKYTDGTTDKYGISKIVEKAFLDRGFNVISDNECIRIKSTPDFQYVLYVYIAHTFIYDALNTITLSMYDCRAREVLRLEGRGLGFTPQQTFKQATRRAFESLGRFKYRFDPEKAPDMEFPDIEKTQWDENKLRHYYDSCLTKLDAIEGIYKTIAEGATPAMRIGIYKEDLKYKAVVLETTDLLWKPGEVKAIFEEANGLYSVRWYMGNKAPYETFAGWSEFGILKVHFGQNQDPARLIRIYPLSSDQSATPSGKGRPANPSNQAIASGTGFVISKDGYIATNAHVVEGANRITVDLLDSSGQSRRYEAIPIVTDSKNDVAVIKIEDDSFKHFKTIPYTLEPRANIGAEVFTIGFPLNSIMGANYKVANGIISAKTGINDNISEYQITVPIQPGNSGGPLINKDGNIVGITSAGLNGDAIGAHVENVNYAVKILYLMNAINAIPKMEEMPDKSMTEGKSLEEQIDIIKDYICLIKIY